MRPEPDKDTKGKKTIDHYEYEHKNHQENMSQLSPETHKKNYIPLAKWDLSVEY